jgi:hypothetical protein
LGILELALVEALVSSQAALLSIPTCFPVNGQTFPEETQKQKRRIINKDIINLKPDYSKNT